MIHLYSVEFSSTTSAHRLLKQIFKCFLYNNFSGVSSSRRLNFYTRQNIIILAAMQPENNHRCCHKILFFFFFFSHPSKRTISVCKRTQIRNCKEFRRNKFSHYFNVKRFVAIFIYFMIYFH
jgi:hypothetical protein